MDDATRAAIDALVVEFAWLVDHGRAAEVADLFTDDGVFAGPGLELHGRPQILDAFQGRAALQRTSRHVISNVRLAREADDRARGTVVLTLYRHDGSGVGLAHPALVGEYDDVYARGADGRWRFAERRFTVVFAGGAKTPRA